MKLQALFSSKIKSKKIKMWAAAIFVWHFKRYVSQLNIMNGHIRPPKSPVLFHSFSANF